MRKKNNHRMKEIQFVTTFVDFYDTVRNFKSIYKTIT